MTVKLQGLNLEWVEEKHKETGASRSAIIASALKHFREGVCDEDLEALLMDYERNLQGSPWRTPKND